MIDNDDFKVVQTVTVKELAKALWAELFCDNAFDHRSTEDLSDNDNIANMHTIRPDDIPRACKENHDGLRRSHGCTPTRHRRKTAPHLTGATE